MKSVGSLEAKTRWSQLLERVAAGERILITNRGRPVAMLVPPEIEARPNSAEAARQMLAYRDRVQRSLGGAGRDLAHEGHRF